MAILDYIKGVINKVLKKDSKKAYNTDIIESSLMDVAHMQSVNVYKGFPTWLNSDDDVKTINFAKTISGEMARLVTLDCSLEVEGSGRGEYINKRITPFMSKISDTVEKWCVHGSLVLVPNSFGIDVINPFDFYVTSIDAEKNVTGIIYFDYYQQSKKFYTRAVWQRFEDGVYYISNKAFVADKHYVIGKEIPLTETVWATYEPETSIILGNQEETKPLFVMLNLPTSNNIDEYSPISVSIYSDCMTELSDLDVAYSRHTLEIKDSKKIVLIDDRLASKAGKKITDKSDIDLPHYATLMYGSSDKEFYQEINPVLQSEIRIKGINHILDMIAYKIGFSNGYFNFDEKTGMVTATQVESENSRTINTVKTYRDVLQRGIDDLIYAINVIADLDGIPVGNYETNYNFGDITYSYEEDKSRWYQMAMQGFIPKWMYLNKFEGFTEEEAKAIQDEITANEEPQGLFGG